MGRYGRSRAKHRKVASTVAITAIPILCAVSCEGKFGQSSITAITTPPPVDRVNVIPSTASVAIGGYIQLTATPLDSAGKPLTDRTVAWISSNPQTATVDQSGFVSALSEGEVTITATSEGVSGTATVTVLGQAGVLFQTGWTTALGAGRDAITDGGVWDQTWCEGDHLLSVVDGGSVSAPGGNALRVQQRGVLCGAVEVNDFGPVGQDYYLRFYLRNDDTGSAVNHYATIDVMGYNCLTFHSQMSHASGWQPWMIMSCNGSYPTDWWFLRDPGTCRAIDLDYGKWYRFEFWVEWISSTKFRVHPRIYSHPDGTLLYDEDDYVQHDCGAAGGLPGPPYGQQWTLRNWYDEGNMFTFSIPNDGNDFGVGNNGATTSTPTGQYWYYAAVEIRNDTWAGPDGDG